MIYIYILYHLKYERSQEFLMTFEIHVAGIREHDIVPESYQSSTPGQSAMCRHAPDRWAADKKIAGYISFWWFIPI